MSERQERGGEVVGWPGERAEKGQEGQCMTGKVRVFLRWSGRYDFASFMLVVGVRGLIIRGD